MAFSFLRPKTVEGAWPVIGSYQTEGAEHRQALDVGQTQLHEAEGHDDAVKDVPAHLEVVVGVHGNELEDHLSREDTGEHLEEEEEDDGHVDKMVKHKETQHISQLTCDTNDYGLVEKTPER